MIYYRKSTYDEILPLWKKLWSKHDFESTSCMLYLGGYDPNIPKKYAPCFFAAIENDRPIGVLSAHHSSPEHCRLRGLFVEPEFRNNGVASKLVEMAIGFAQNSHAKLVWATPRRNSLGIFMLLGFNQTGDFITEGFQYGPNCYVSLSL